MAKRCYSCSQENCGTTHCSCSCHNEPGDWESYQAMLEDILRHRLATGDEIIPADERQRIQFIAFNKAGGDTPGKSWTIRLSALAGQQLTGIFAQFKGDRHILNLFLNGEYADDPDLDLELMSLEKLKAEAKKLRAGIRKHRDATGHDLCWFHPELWNLLPDKIEPKPQVPPKDEFLHHCKLYRESLGD